LNSPSHDLGCDRNNSQRTARSANDFQWCGDNDGASRRKLIKIRQTRRPKLAVRCRE
jgi:hypothetical protein